MSDHQQTEVKELFFAPLMSLGGIVDKFDPAHIDWLRTQADFVSKKGNITAQCFTLHSLLLAVGQTEVDYFSLDVEGPETRYLTNHSLFTKSQLMLFL